MKTSSVLRNTLLNLPKLTVSEQLRELLLGVWHDRLKPHAIVLTYLATRNFNVIRFPTRPDRSVDGQGYGFHDAVNLLDSYTDQQLDSLSNELANLTQQTKTILLAHSGPGPITLERAICPLNDTQYQTANRPCDNIELYPRLALAAKTAQLSSISLDVDILSGWSTTSTQRYGCLHLTRRWAIEDVLLVSDLLEGPMEGNEWLCVNRNPRGHIAFDLTDIRLDELPQAIIDEIARSPSVRKLAQDLQMDASQGAVRSIAYRPTPEWWNADRPLPELSWWQNLTTIVSRNGPKNT